MSVKTGKNVKEALDALLLDINRKELKKIAQEEQTIEKKEKQEEKKEEFK